MLKANQVTAALSVQQDLRALRDLPDRRAIRETQEILAQQDPAAKPGLRVHRGYREKRGLSVVSALRERQDPPGLQA